MLLKVPQTLAYAPPDDTSVFIQFSDVLLITLHLLVVRLSSKCTVAVSTDTVIIFGFLGALLEALLVLLCFFVSSVSVVISGASTACISAFAITSVLSLLLYTKLFCYMCISLENLEQTQIIYKMYSLTCPKTTKITMNIYLESVEIISL